ncbi:hypothetical protein HII31_01067 [Pseudocercospora fuligena]|uniref:Uncharacterized protein n=1 Tax=Pseudocercospora fuligena TaxID=685502 RepID=A0A8H6VR71_9PEZI|nr:hypothetical protein HII31_01067 [Pseudocercospora fuligena]
MPTSITLADRKGGDLEIDSEAVLQIVGPDVYDKLTQLAKPKSNKEDRKDRPTTVPALAQCLKETTEGAQVQVDNIRAALQNVQTKVHDLEQERSQAQARSAASDEKLLAQDKANADHVRATAAMIAQIRADTNQAINTLTAEVSKLTHENHHLKQQLAELRQPRENEHAQTQEQPDSLRQTVTGLTTRIEDAENLADNGSTEEPTVSAQHQIAADVQRLSDQQWLDIRQSALDDLMEELRSGRHNHLIRRSTANTREVPSEHAGNANHRS